ncbi:MAG: hypothetical protein AAFR81_23775 [Chloroflexota bacterium]
MNRKKVEQTVRALQYDWTTFEFEDFFKHTVEYHGRPIFLQPIPHFEVSGYCVSVREHSTDYIFVRADDHPVSVLHNKIHEIGHFLLKHLKAVKIVDTKEQMIELMMRFSRLRSVENVSPTLASEEHEAEYFAYLVTQQVAKAQRLTALTLETESYDWGVPPFYGRFARQDSKKVDQ